ncbi:MAG: caspase family protein, partial [Spirochaetales bacterium]|nr:caspase family protein [Spirochaetales bacterium]
MADDFESGKSEEPVHKKRFSVKIALCALGVLAAALFFLFTGKDPEAGQPDEPETAEAAAPQIVKGAQLSGVTALAVSRDGKLMLTGSGSGLVRVWAIFTGKQLQVWKAGQESVRALAIDGKSGVLAASLGAGIHVWDRRTQAELFVIETEASTLALEYSADGKELAGLLENGELRFWKSADGKPLRSTVGSSASAAALGSGAGRLLYEDKDAAVLIDTKSNAEIRRLGFAGASALALRPDGAATAADGGKITVWDSTGTEAGGVQNTRAISLALTGTKVFSGGEDGGVYMWDIATGELIARYVGFGTSAEDSEWISITANGYYVTSEKGSSLLTVQGKDGELTMDQFREALHRPDLVAKTLRGEKEEAKQTKDSASLAGLLRESDKRPLVEIVGPAKRTSGESSEKVQIRITDRGLGAERIMIYNGELCSGFSALDEVVTGRKEAGGKTVYEATLTIQRLKPGRNSIAITVFGGREHWAMESDKARLEITTSYKPPAVLETRPVLHVFTAAIKTYAAEELNLKYTTADAEALKKSLARQGTTGKLYSDVKTYTLFDEKVTKEGLAREFDAIEPKVGEEDTFVFFFSGHGAVDDYKDFYFLPADAQGWTASPEKNILKHDLLGNLLKIKARNIFVMLDTCQSGALGDMTSAVDRAWTDLGQQTNLAILMAAAGNQYAIESEEDAQGVLAWSVLRALGGQARRREERYLEAGEMLEYVRRDAPVKAEQVVAYVIQKQMQSGRAEEVAVKGVFDTASLAQEPAIKHPRKSFDLFDLKWRPAKVTFTTRTAGELRIHGSGAEQTEAMEAGRPKTISLRDGAYEFTMNYKAAVAPETIAKNIVNAAETTVAFKNTP